MPTTPIRDGAGYCTGPIAMPGPNPDWSADTSHRRQVRFRSGAAALDVWGTAGVEPGVAGRCPAYPCSWVTEQEAPARSFRQWWESPVFTERASVGLDVHARSVAAAAIDSVTGRVFQTKLTPS